nr:hypothetical protein KPHV_08230 [Kitasatospora purpeofusca]
MTRPPWLWRGMLAEHGVTEGRLLRRIDRLGHISEKLHPGPVYDLSKRLVAAVGLEKDAEGRVFTAHGWRASGRSAARDAGASAEAADRHGRWKPGSQTGRGYERDRGEYGDHPMVKVAAEQRRARTAVPVPARPGPRPRRRSTGSRSSTTSGPTARGGWARTASSPSCCRTPRRPSSGTAGPGRRGLLPGPRRLRSEAESSSGPEGRASSRCAAVDGLPGTGPWVTRPVRGPKGPVAQVPPGLPVETSRRTDEPGATGCAPPRG